MNSEIISSNRRVIIERYEHRPGFVDLNTDIQKALPKLNSNRSVLVSEGRVGKLLKSDGRTFYNTGITPNGYYVPSFEYRNGKQVPISLRNLATAKLPTNHDEHFNQSRLDLDLSEPDANGTMTREGFTGKYTKGNNGEIVFHGGHPTNNPQIKLSSQTYINGVWYKAGVSGSQSYGNSDGFTTHSHISPSGPVYGGLYTQSGYDHTPTQSGLHSSPVLYNGNVRNEFNTYRGEAVYFANDPINGEIFNPRGSMPYYYSYQPNYSYQPTYSYRSQEYYPSHSFVPARSNSPGVLSRMFGWMF